jgi:hypothetical protein
MRKILVTFIPGLIGGLVGGFLGYYLVGALWKQGFYTVVLPGALAGLGCGLCSWTNSTTRGLICALEAAAFGLVTEWLVMYGPRESSLENFVGFIRQFDREPWVTDLMLGIGVFLGFWWGREATFPWRHRFGSAEGKDPAKADRPVIDE